MLRLVESSLVFTVIKGILMPIVAIFLVNGWNFFDSISFIPSDKVYEVGLTAYLCILECICFKVINLVKSNKSNIECVFFNSGADNSIDNTPEISFVNDVAYINFRLKLSGKAKKLRKNVLMISFPDWLDIQSVNNSSMSVIDNKKCKFILDKMISNSDTNVENVCITFKVAVIKNYTSDSNCSITLIPELEKKLLYEFSFNKFKLI